MLTAVNAMWKTQFSVGLNTFPNVKRWYDTVGARPAVQKGMAVPAPS